MQIFEPPKNQERCLWPHVRVRHENNTTTYFTTTFVPGQQDFCFEKNNYGPGLLMKVKPQFSSEELPVI